MIDFIVEIMGLLKDGGEGPQSVYPSKMAWEYCIRERVAAMGMGVAPVDDGDPGKRRLSVLRYVFFKYVKGFFDYLHIQVKDLKTEVTENLLEFQKEHVKKLVATLQANRCVLDASETGTGKTYAALATCKQLDKNAVVICPKSVIGTWHEVADMFNVKIFAKNIEQYKNGKTPFVAKTVKCSRGKNKKSFVWQNLHAENTVVIFDEAHCLKNYATQNTELGRTLIDNTCMQVMFLSATIAESPQDLVVTGQAINLFERGRFWKFMLDHGVVQDPFGSLKYNGKYNDTLYNKIFRSNRGHGIKKDASIGFQECEVISSPLDIEVFADIQKQYQAITDLEQDFVLNKITATERNVQRMQRRQEIETLKTPAFFDHAKALLDEGNSVAIFVNFINTAKELSELFSAKKIDHGVIMGSVDQEQRNRSIQRFQKDEIHVMILTIQAGGIGISLHDTIGNRQRCSIISPTDDARLFKQVLGRTDRAGSKTKTIQRILLCRQTVEEEIARNIKRKVKNLDEIRGDELMPMRIARTLTQKKPAELLQA